MKWKNIIRLERKKFRVILLGVFSFNKQKNNPCRYFCSVSFRRNGLVRNELLFVKINASYSYGGPKLLADTIEKNFRVKLDNYVRVNFESFKKIDQYSRWGAGYLNKSGSR